MAPPRPDHRAALARLRAAGDSGALDALCRRHGVTVLGAFGSATRPPTGDGARDGEPEPADLDLAVGFARGAEPDLLALLDDLAALCGPAEIDLLDLRRADPVARTAGLVGGVPLHEEERGDFARAQLAAVKERMDTAWLRRLELELLAS